MPDSSKKYTVSAQNLTKKFHSGTSEIKALDGINLTISPGEFTAVMGASGSGKSTLLHLLAGLIQPDDGTLLVGGKDLRKMRDRELTLFRRDNIGLVFQSFNLIPTLTVEENIALPMLSGNGHLPPGEEMDQLLNQLGLEARRGHRPDALSGGEQQRAAIGRALLMEPDILLADEPTGNLDSVNSEKICDIFTQLHTEQKRTLLIVTHEPNVALRAQRIIILKDGKIIADEPSSRFSNTQELATYYQSLV